MLCLKHYCIDSVIVRVSVVLSASILTLTHWDKILCQRIGITILLCCHLHRQDLVLFVLLKLRMCFLLSIVIDFIISKFLLFKWSNTLNFSRFLASCKEEMCLIFSFCLTLILINIFFSTGSYFSISEFVGTWSGPFVLARLQQKNGLL